MAKTKVLVAGDFSPRELLALKIEEGVFSDLFGEIQPIVSDTDYAIVNLEAPVVIDSDAKPIAKIGPNLKCSHKSIEALAYAGFDMVTLANNHFYDFGDIGVHDTITACDGVLDIVGGGLSLSEACRPFRKWINDRFFTIINCCEHEYSIATNHSGGSNPLNPFVVFHQIMTAKERGDTIVVIVHGGRELFQYPTVRMKETYRFFIDAGASAVINHHQHCYCGYEEYKGGLIFYGLGNFCFYNKKFKDSLWNYGYLVELFFGDRTVTYKLIPYKQCSNKMGVFILQGNDLTAFKEKISELSESIQDDDILSAKLSDFVKQPEKNPMVTFEPYSSHFLSALRRRNWLPSFVSARKKENIKAKILCESHRDCILEALK